MRTKKILSAVTAMILTATAMLGTGALQASAAEKKTLTFDLRSGGKNEIKVSAEQIAAGDFTVPVDIFIPENPGVNAINLKLQVNDGQVDKNGKFGNYGLYLNDAAFSSPFCFDSASKGDVTASIAQTFNSKDMNVSWVFSQDPKQNADAAVQADTTAWDASVAWAYSNPFAKANLVIPKGTPAGTYQFNIRKDKYINARSAESGTPKYSVSSCTGAESESALDFKSVPLTVTVEDTVKADTWEDTYKIENGGHYYIIGDVCGKPGETVEVPVYVFGDSGTAGVQVYFDLDTKMSLEAYEEPKEKRAYSSTPQTKTESRPATYTFARTRNYKAEDGSILTLMKVIIPSSASDGDVYDIKFHDDSTSPLKVIDYNGEKLPVTFYNGSVTVLTDNKTALNRKAVNLTEIGQTTNLNLFNATGDVTWTSSDPSVATVDSNGFVKTVGKGTTTITATNNGTAYTATVKVGGLFGDVDQNGEISSADAQLTLNHYVETMSENPSPLTADQQKIADVSGDGIADITDAQMILNYYVDKVVSGLDSTTWRTVTKNPNAPEN